jgi:RimJ/RimL family protein N-acetyltransferase
MTPFEIRELGADHAEALSGMLLASSPDYQQYFIPFSFDVGPIRHLLATASRDRYWGIWWGEELAAFFMLRGLDEGHEIPSFGVSVAERFARRGLLRLSLCFAIAWCRLNAIARLMLKVHPDNTVARREYERFGFRYDRTDPSNGHLVCDLQLGDR